MASKPPKGMQDACGDRYAARDELISRVVGVFRAHGAEGMDTPVAELKAVLTAKYGEEGESLIYDLQDQGGELLSLRYDLTVPLARFISTSGRKSLRRYQVGKVYRRDNPAMNSGRFREFYQADFDIVGDHPSMWADAEVIATAVAALHAAGVTGFRVAVNHCSNLEALLAGAGVAPGMLRTVCSSIDKLDKAPWPEVRGELVAKGVSPECADAVGDAVSVRGPLVATVAAASEACRAELTELGRLLGAFGVLELVDIDFSLARGLTYYTGMIFEVKLAAGGGSVAAGGRYDDLLGTVGRHALPAVGFSVGIDRLLGLVGGRAPSAPALRVFVATSAADSATQKLHLLALLWAAGIDARYQMKADPALPPQFRSALKQGCTHIAIVGDTGVGAGQVVVKDLSTHGRREAPVEGVVGLFSAPLHAS